MEKTMTGRILFGAVLAIVGLLYLGAAGISLFSPGGFLQGNVFGALLFGVVGIAAAVASVNLLREKRR
jgi:hypothetical protein